MKILVFNSFSSADKPPSRGFCSSDDDTQQCCLQLRTRQSQAPEWQIDWSNDQERPDWTEPDGSLYENWTILMVQMEEALQPYVSEDDMMAIFINGELRGLASPATTVDGDQTGTAMFLMKAYGNESSKERVNISLQYYSHRLKLYLHIVRGSQIGFRCDHWHRRRLHP